MASKVSLEEVAQYPAGSQGHSLLEVQLSGAHHPMMNPGPPGQASGRCSGGEPKRGPSQGPALAVKYVSEDASRIFQLQPWNHPQLF